MPEEYIPLSAALEVINNPELLHYWTSTGYAPTDERGNIHAAFLQRVVTFSAPHSPTTEDALFCLLEWQTARKEYEPATIATTVAELIASGQAMTVRQIAKATGYHRDIVRRWNQLGFLPSVLVWTYTGHQINTVRIARSESARRVIEVLGYLTSDEAATQLDLTVGIVSRYASEGRLTGIKTPVGWRFHPRNIAAIRSRRRNPRGLTAEQVRSTLGISRASFTRWAARGVFSFITDKSKRRWYNEVRVNEIKAELETIQGGFDWLPFDKTCPQITAHAAARRLGVTKRTISRWRELGLLPHFRLTPKELEPAFAYVREYVEGLVAYMTPRGGTSPALAREYKAFLHEYYSSNRS